MKLSRLMSVACGLAFLGAVTAFADPDPNFHIYLAFGQSNMEGQGDIEQQDKTVDPRFQMLQADEKCSDRKLGEWYDAVPPLAHCHGAKLGPTDYFGRTMVEKTDEKIRVGVIVIAVGGCSIQLFESNLSQSYMSTQADWFKERVNAYGGNPYNRLIEMGKKAQEDGVIKGIIFHQGETDNGDAQWPSKVKAVYDNIIKDLGLGDDIPFLAGEVFRGNQTYNGALQNINKLPQQSKNFYVVSSEGFNQSLNDMMNVHFTSQEYRDFGARYAEKMIEVLGDKIKPVETETPESSSSAPESSSEEVASSSSEAVASSSSEVAPASSSENAPASSAVESSSDAAPASSTDVESSDSGVDAVAVSAVKGMTIGHALVSENAVVVPLTLKNASSARITVYSVLGQQIVSLNRELAAGENTLSLDKSLLPAGNYVISVQVGSARTMARVRVSR